MSYIVTTTVIKANGEELPTVSLDSPGTTRELMDAYRLRDSYIVTLCSLGSTVVTPVDGDRRGFLVRQQGPRHPSERITIVPAP